MRSPLVGHEPPRPPLHSFIPDWGNELPTHLTCHLACKARHYTASPDPPRQKNLNSLTTHAALHNFFAVTPASLIAPSTCRAARPLVRYLRAQCLGLLVSGAVHRSSVRLVPSYLMRHRATGFLVFSFVFRVSLLILCLSMSGCLN
eukprot:scaffold51165_cov32-Tisochrysis_lutea.AAC.8